MTGVAVGAGREPLVTRNGRNLILVVSAAGLIASISLGARATFGLYSTGTSGHSMQNSFTTRPKFHRRARGWASR